MEWLASKKAVVVPGVMKGQAFFWLLGFAVLQNLEVLAALLAFVGLSFLTVS